MGLSFFFFFFYTGMSFLQCFQHSSLRSLPFLALHNHRMLFSLIEVFANMLLEFWVWFQKTKLSKTNNADENEKKLFSLKLKHPLSFIYRIQTLLNTPLLSSQGSRVPGILTKKSEAPMTSERGRLSYSLVPLNRAFFQGQREPFV